MRGVWVAVFVLVAGCAGSGTPDKSRPVETDDATLALGTSIDTADWRPGYVFSHKITISGMMQFQIEEAGAVQEASVPLSESFEETIEVLSVDATFEGEPLYLVAVESELLYDSVTSDSELLKGRILAAVRQSDLQAIGTFVHYPDCPATCRPDGLRFEELPSHYSWLRFPLADGATWSGEADGGDEFGSMSVESSAHVPSADLATVDHVVRSVLPPESIRQSMEEIGATDVHVEATLAGNRTITFDASKHTASDDLFFFDVHEDIRLTTPEGEPARLVLDAHLTLENRLLSAHLEERADPGLEAILDGLTLPEAPKLVLGLAVNRSDLNAAVAPVAALSLYTEGPLDADIEVAVGLQGPLGDVPLAYANGRLEAVFDEPGLYLATAVATRGGKEVAKAELPIPVRYEVDIELACPDPAVDGVADCPILEMPVRPGLVSLHVEAASDGPTALALAKLSLTDAAGKAASADFSMGDATLDVQDLAGFVLDGRNWTLAYKPTVGHGDKVTGHVLLSAAPAGDASGLQARFSLTGLAGWPPPPSLSARAWAAQA